MIFIQSKLEVTMRISSWGVIEEETLGEAISVTVIFLGFGIEQQQ